MIAMSGIKTEMKMKVLFYISENCRSRDRFEKEVMGSVPKNDQEKYQKFEFFSRRLRENAGHSAPRGLQ